jgi:hypothetical protein
LSAPFPMCRTVNLVVMLAALAVSAYGAQASISKTHRRASGAHRAHHPAASERSKAIHHEARSEALHRQADSGTASASARRLSADEVGRAAGLKIRHEMGQRVVSEHPRRSAERFRRARYAESSRFRRARIIHASLREAAPVYRPAIDDTRSDDGRSEDGRSLTRPAEAASVPEPAPAETRPETGAVPAVRPEDAQAETAGASEAPAASGTQPNTESESTEDLAPPPGAETDTEQASLYIPRGAMPPPLRGSLESLERQNERLTAEGLERIEDEDDLSARIANGLLVPVPVSAALTVNPDLPLNHRYCRPWTARFLRDLAAAHDALFHRPLDVSSAVRPVTYQKRLMRVNGNAAPAEGDVVSPHMTGATVDIAKSGLSRSEMNWMRRRLLALEAEGKIDVEEEFRQRCFHITVYKTYASRGTTPAIQTHSAPKSRDTKSDTTPAGEVAAQGQ